MILASDQEYYFSSRLSQLKRAKNKKDALVPDSQKYYHHANFGSQILNQSKLTLNDGVEEEDDEEEEGEEEENQINQSKQQDAAANLRQKQEQAKKKQESAAKAKKAVDNTKKIAQAAKTAKSLKQFLMLVKVGTGITVWGLIITLLVMLVQYIFGNLLKVTLVPKLALWEQAILLGVIFVIFLNVALSLYIVYFLLENSPLGLALKLIN